MALFRASASVADDGGNNTLPCDNAQWQPISVGAALRYHTPIARRDPMSAGG